MPFCPRCGFEYEIGVGTCPDCDVKLVEKPPDLSNDEDKDETSESKYENWIPIVHLNSSQIGEMLCEGLEAKDIPAVVQESGRFLGRAGGGGITASSPIDDAVVLVPEEFLEDAIGEARIMLGDEWDKWKLVDIDDQEK